MWIVLIQRPSGLIETVGPFKDEFSALRWAADAVDKDCDYEIHNVSSGKMWRKRNQETEAANGE